MDLRVDTAQEDIQHLSFVLRLKSEQLVRYYHRIKVRTPSRSFGKVRAVYSFQHPLLHHLLLPLEEASGIFQEEEPVISADRRKSG